MLSQGRLTLVQRLSPAVKPAVNSAIQFCFEERQRFVTTEHRRVVPDQFIVEIQALFQGAATRGQELVELALAKADAMGMGIVK